MAILFKLKIIKKNHGVKTFEKALSNKHRKNDILRNNY